jgi:hypothetical protein
MVKCCVFFAVRTEFLNIIYTSFGFKGLVIEWQHNFCQWVWVCLVGFEVLTAVSTKMAVLPWWWRQQGPLKRWYISTRLHGATTQKTAIWVCLICHSVYQDTWFWEWGCCFGSMSWGTDQRLNHCFSHIVTLLVYKPCRPCVCAVKDLQGQEKLSTKFMPILRPAGGVVGSKHGGLGSKKHIHRFLFPERGPWQGKPNIRHTELPNRTCRRFTQAVQCIPTLLGPS